MTNFLTSGIINMIYDVEIVIIDPRTYKAKETNCIISLEYVPDYEDIVHEFFHQWNKPDKYEICYAIGVKSMKLHDNKD